MRKACICADCGKNTTPELDFANYDWYVVRDEVWAEAWMTTGFLCTPCLEARLGRALVDGDYLMRTVGLTYSGNLDLRFSPDYEAWRAKHLPLTSRARS